MQILKIGQTQIIRNNSFTRAANCNDSNTLHINRTQNLNCHYGKDLVTFRGLERIPMTEIASRTPKDIAYLNSLADSIGSSVENLKSIVGLDEFKSIAKNLSAENYNPRSPKFMANNHTHTVFSDGKSEYWEILDEAQARGAEGNNFLLTITDHDTLSTPREAVKHIAQNPEKYKNVRFILGIEPTLKYTNSKILKMPIPFDAIGYCINPFDKTTIDFFEGTIDKNRQYARDIIQKVNERWGVNEKLENAYGFHPLIKTGGSTGFLKYVKKYLQETLMEKGKGNVSEELTEMFKPYYANQNGRATIATPEVKDAINAIKRSGYGEIGLAHPAITEINPENNRTLDLTSGINLQDGIKYNDALAEFIKTSGLNIAERHYQYSTGQFKRYPQFEEIVNVANKTCDEQGILATGGTDSHNNVPNKILESR